MVGSAHAQSDTFPPSPPTGLTATLSGVHVALAWTGSTDNVGVAGYYVYKNGSIIANTVSTSYTDTVTPGVSVYTIVAYDAAGNMSPASTPASVTLTPDTIPPSTPGDFTATSTGSSTVSLSWAASTDNVGVVGYYVYRNGLPLQTSSTITGTSYVDSPVPPGTYTYAVSAYDANGNISESSNHANVTIILDQSPPTTPTGLTVLQVATSSSEIAVSWQPSWDNVAVVGYYLYRAGSQIANLTGATNTTYLDTGLTPATLYPYTVAAYDGAGNVSSQSQPAQATTLPPDTTAPFVPSGVSPVAQSTSSVLVSWNPTTDNIAVAGYNLYRNGVEIATLNGPTSTSYTDTGVMAGLSYNYTVNAFDAAGNVSEQSAPGSVVVPTETPVAPLVPLLATTTASATAPLAEPAIQPLIAPSSSVPAATTTLSGTPLFNTFLYEGLRTPEVTSLQNLLAEHGYLNPIYVTGFFGMLTQAAVEKFQCDQNIVCTDGPGWGLVGIRTRAALNSLVQAAPSGSAVASANASGQAAASSTASVSSLQAELQALEAELAQLQAQAGQ